MYMIHYFLLYFSVAKGCGGGLMFVGNQMEDPEDYYDEYGYVEDHQVEVDYGDEDQEEEQEDSGEEEADDDEEHEDSDYE